MVGGNPGKPMVLSSSQARRENPTGLIGPQIADEAFEQHRGELENQVVGGFDSDDHFDVGTGVAVEIEGDGRTSQPHSSSVFDTLQNRISPVCWSSTNARNPSSAMNI